MRSHSLGNLPVDLSKVRFDNVEPVPPAEANRVLEAFMPESCWQAPLLTPNKREMNILCDLAKGHSPASIGIARHCGSEYVVDFIDRLPEKFGFNLSDLQAKARYFRAKRGGGDMAKKFIRELLADREYAASLVSGKAVTT